MRRWLLKLIAGALCPGDYVLVKRSAIGQGTVRVRSQDGQLLGRTTLNL